MALSIFASRVSEGELWQFEAAGTIQSAVGHKCLQAAGDSVSLSSCAHASSWELTASGQLKSPALRVSRGGRVVSVSCLLFRLSIQAP